MINLQVYIKSYTGDFEQIELYKDESVTLTQSIQDIRDISKIFTDFTKTFNVPASKTNNRILRHFYSAEVASYNLGVKLECKLYLNHQFFRKGKIRLEGATMKDHKAHTYKLTFFGDTIQLPDLIGDDTLQSLTYLSYINFTYDGSTVKSYLQDGLDVTANGETHTDALIVPLISHTKRLYYDSTADVADTGNLAIGSANKGVVFNDLKPAVRLHYIIRAIEDRYRVKFDSSFFNTSNSVYYDLYMWMHNNKGKLLVDTADIAQAPRVLIKDYQNNGGLNWSRNQGEEYNYVANDYWQFRQVANEQVRFTMQVNVFTDNENYNVFIYNNGTQYGNAALYNVSGNQTLTAQVGNMVGNSPSAIPFGRFQVFVQSTEDAEFRVAIDLAEQEYSSYSNQAGVGDIEDEVGQWLAVDRTSIVGYATSSDEVNFSGATQMPDIKVMDFLTGLFKMFNLTAYVDDNGIIKVTPLDTFYANSKNTWNITEYLDTTDSSVSKLTPYKSLKFQYEGLDTFFASHHKAFFAKDWGTEIYQNESRLEGETYEITLPFEHHKFERLIDTNNSLTDIQWGWSVNDDKESIIGLPLIFYPHKVTSGTPISFQETINTKESLTTYYVPLNHRLPTTDSQTLHFSLEASEYAIGTDQTAFTKSLYNEYYDTYIRETFNARRRMYTFKAYLPLRILLNLTLADRVVIFGTLYKINTLKTNFATGLSTLELINDVSDFKFNANAEDLAEDVSQPYITVDNTTVTADNTPTV